MTRRLVQTPRRHDRGAGLLLILLLTVATSLLAPGCRSPLKPREVCLQILADPSLNLYNGEAHALNLLIYPMTGAAAFQEASIDDLLAERDIQGAAGPALSVMINPGEFREFRETLPATTRYVGVVANYYQAGSERPGNRRALLTGKCSLFGRDQITLTSRDVLVD